MRSGSLVEREQQLRTLREVLVEPAGSGSVVLLSGEAGFGKTSLLDALVGQLDHRIRVMTAMCEPIGVPAAFAPLFDVLEHLPDDLASEIRSGGKRNSVYAGILDVLKNDRVLLVIEDLHWADEATLGLVRYLGKRIGATNSSLVVTYRSEEIDLNPPLRLVVADLGPAAVRIELPPLSVAGVKAMAGHRDIDAEAVHSATLGNPFFVEEVIRNSGTELPPTVQNAILASASLLPEEALEFLRMVALSPEGLPIEELDAGAARHADLAFQRRLLTSTRGQLACRHELIRQSLAQTTLPALKQRLHKRLLEALERRASGSVDTARLAFHSIEADERAKAIAYSLRAADDAARSGAHRQAAFHYANALEFEEAMDSSTLSDTLLAAGREHIFINAFETAVAYGRRRLDLVGDSVEQARARAWVSFFEARKNDLVATRTEATSAIAGLSSGPACEELALAMAVLAWVELVEGDWERARTIGEEAIRIAKASDVPGLEVYAATHVGTARWLLGEQAGLDQVGAAARLGIASGAGEFAAKALNNLGVINLYRGRLEDARHWFTVLQEYTTNHELDAWYIAAVTTMAWIDVTTGRWDQADRDLEIVSGQRTCLQTEIEALVVAARLRLRRGDPGIEELAGEVFDRLSEFNDLEAQVSGCVLAMEGAWTGVLPLQAAVERYERIRQSPLLAADRSARSQLAFWAHRLGLDPPGGDYGEGIGLELDGRLAEASDRWERRGFHLEAAVTRAMTPHADLDSVFADLTRVGATGVTRGLRRELGRRGVKPVPRGERPETRRHPAGLTGREVEVLGRLATGLSNAAIADELFISKKTAGHHVSAILSKLGVSSRGQAASVAIANGWVQLERRK